MGNSSSRKEQVCYADVMKPFTTQVFEPLRFHAVHGRKITLSRNDTVASRCVGEFCDGIVFGHRPVHFNEYIYIRILSTRTLWSGSLEVAITNVDPLAYQTMLPENIICSEDKHLIYSQGDLDRLAVQDTLLFFYIDEKGKVHYGVNRTELGTFSGCLTDRFGSLWAMIDVYGQTQEIELVDPRSLFPESLGMEGQEEPLTLTTSLAEASSLPLTPPSTPSPSQIDKITLKPIFLYHKPEWGSIELRRNGTIAAFTGAAIPPYAFSDRPIIVNECILIKVLKTNEETNEHFTVGVTSCDPSTLAAEDFPSDPEDLYMRSEYWVVHEHTDEHDDQELQAYVIESDGALKCSKNGQPFSTLVYVDETMPLWFFMNLNGPVVEIRVLGIFEGASEVAICSFFKTLKDQPDDSLESEMIPVHEEQPVDETKVAECVICCERDSDCALYRCGHICMCYVCATQLKESGDSCPLCRQEIIDILKVYM